MPVPSLQAAAVHRLLVATHPIVAAVAMELQAAGVAAMLMAMELDTVVDLLLGSRQSQPCSGNTRADDFQVLS